MVITCPKLSRANSSVGLGGTGPAANSEYLQAKTRYLILTGRREEVKP